jgi:DNA-binding response OmpR family regulator
MAARDTQAMAALPSSRQPGTVTGTVLVVEDEEVLRRAVSKMLRKERFSVLEAGDGTTGANLFRANESNIDVVLLDLTLPGMSGRDVLSELRRIRPEVKVILTTAYSQENALSAIGEQRPWSYVRKPYQFSDLLNLLRKACLDRPQVRGSVAG